MLGETLLGQRGRIVTKIDLEVSDVMRRNLNLNVNHIALLVRALAWASFVECLRRIWTVSAYSMLVIVINASRVNCTRATSNRSIVSTVACKWPRHPAVTIHSGHNHHQ
jgi:hypothetical protein